jgi:hypothetical protein
MQREGAALFSAVLQTALRSEVEMRPSKVFCAVLLHIAATFLTTPSLYAQDIPGGHLITNQIWVETLEPGDYAQQDNPPCLTKDMNNAPALVSAAAATDFTKVGTPAILVKQPLVALAIYVLTSQTKDWLRKQGGDIAKALVPDRYASCAVVTFDKRKFPEYKQFATRVWMAEKGKNLDACKERAGNWTKCNVGWAAVSRTEDSSFITYVVKNWSGDRTRAARLDVYGYKQAGTCPTNLGFGNLGVDCSN